MEGENIDLVVSGQHTTAEVKDRHVIPVPFVQQCYSWDCGLACVSMILRMFDESCDDVYTKDLDSLQCGESVWTIDLAYILNRHNVHSCLYTVTLGVNTSHLNKIFYQKHFSVDEIRVNNMFNKASQLDILIQRRSLSVADLIDHLQDDNPIISLVDWTLMDCVWCGSQVRKCWSCITCNQGPYQGHFVVVVGFDRQKDLVYYKNPDGRSHDLCGIQTDQFQKARMSDGTDQDTLFIYNHKFEGMSNLYKLWATLSVLALQDRHVYMLHNAQQPQQKKKESVCPDEHPPPPAPSTPPPAPAAVV